MSRANWAVTAQWSRFKGSCGGPAAQGWVCENELRANGFAMVEAIYEEHVSHRTNWCPTENGAPISIMGTPPSLDHSMHF
eukprot:1721859-Pyramimonas_sp.AAC.1